MDRKSTTESFDSGLVVREDDIRNLVNGNLHTRVNSRNVADMIYNIVEYRLRLKLNTIVDAAHLKEHSVLGYLKLADIYGTKSVVVSLKPGDTDTMVSDMLKDGTRTITAEEVDVQRSVYDNHSKYFDQTNFYEFESSFQASDFIHCLINWKVNVRDNEDLWLIGDVHSCHEELRDVVERCKGISTSNGRKPIFYQTGDLIDRGPSLERTFDVVFEYGIRYVMGNHEYKFLEEQSGREKCNCKSRYYSHIEYDFIKDIHKKESILNSMLHAKPYYLFGKGEETVMLTHHGVDLSERDIVGCSVLDTALSTPNLDTLEKSGIRQVYGHSSWMYIPIGEQISNNRTAINIDGGVVYGGELVAYNPFTQEYVTVGAKKTHYVKPSMNINEEM